MARCSFCSTHRFGRSRRQTGPFAICEPPLHVEHPSVYQASSLIGRAPANILSIYHTPKPATKISENEDARIVNERIDRAESAGHSVDDGLGLVAETPRPLT